ncbi:MAG: PD40 domain-containing protein [Candidatus Latescibacteria bacterium]|nr:PD40 domain-containing protein [Candidatus Latescibacterota bacterium]
MPRKKAPCIIILTMIFFAGVFPHAGAVSARYDPHIDWRVVRTDHFTLYYPRGHEAFARRVLSLSEGVRDDVTGYFSVSPMRLPIVLYPDTDRFNGFYSVLPHRISLYETPLPDFMWIGTSTDDLVKGVFVHEYTHFAHITSSRGLKRIFPALFGKGAQVMNAWSPGWALEGAATNLETKFTRGGRGRSHYFRGVMRSFDEGPGLWGLSAAGTMNPYGPPSGRIYFAGYFLVEYLDRRFGDGAFAELSRYQSGAVFASAGLALKKVTGLSAEAFYREFAADYSARCDSVRTAARADGLPEGKTVARENLGGFESHWWTERGTIVGLRKSYDKPKALVEIDPVSGMAVKETETGILANFTPVRSLPDGRLVFGGSCYHPLGGGDIDTAELVIYDPAGKKFERLTNNGHVYSADLSPDGSTFAAARRSGMWMELVLLERGGGEMRVLLSHPGVYVDSPVWSPDGSVIAVTLKTPENTDIALVDPRTGTVTLPFSAPTSGEGFPAFSPDGRWIVFGSTMQGVWNIYAWDRRARELYRMTSVYTAALEPRVSPDGALLSFLAVSRGLNEIRTIPFDPMKGELIRVGPGGGWTPPDAGPFEPDVALDDGTIPLIETYKPFLHVPYWADDRGGNAWGVFFMGGDPVGRHAYEAQVQYGSGSGRFGYNLIWRNRLQWPTMTVRAYDLARHDDALTDGRKYWFRERGGELSLELPVIHRVAPDVIASSWEAGARIRRFGEHEHCRIASRHDTALSVFAGVFLEQRPDSAPRDMAPGWGRWLYIAGEEEMRAAAFGEIEGRHMEAVAVQCAPSPFRHHGFEARISHRRRSGPVSIGGGSAPRGYSTTDAEGGLRLPKTATLSIDYRFPILFIDRGVGANVFHAHLLRGSLFTDYGAGWSGSFSAATFSGRARTSVGAAVSLQFLLFSFIPVESGVMAGYKTRDNESFTGVTLDFWGPSFLERHRQRKRWNRIAAW